MFGRVDHVFDVCVQPTVDDLVVHIRGIGRIVAPRLEAVLAVEVLLAMPVAVIKAIIQRGGDC